MPTLMLHHIYYIQLDPVSWCVTAQLVKQQQPCTKRQQQRDGVRQLLQHLLDKLGITDSLDDSHFPYRLSNSRHYVCFSHSVNKIAVVISARRAVGIDIEVQDIAWHVAQRFYHPSEIAILAELPREQRVIISKLLWQIKESLIKIYQYKLAQGLGVSYLSIIPELINSFDRDDRLPVIINDSKTGHQIAILALQQTVIVF